MKERIGETKQIERIVILSTFPVILTVLLGIIIDLSLGELKQDLFFSLITVWVSMALGMIIFPVFYLYKNDRVACTVKKLGLIFTTCDVIVVMVLIIGLFIIKNRIIKADVVFPLLQNIPIAVCEEFWCKSILYTQLNKVLKKPLAIITVSAVVFTFITHSGGGLWDNVLLRFPFALITGYIYYRTNKLVYPVVLHLFYNVIIA